MKIVHIEDFFHPDAGYQVNILSKFQTSNGHKVTIVTSIMDKIPLRLKSFFGYSDIDERDKEFTHRTKVNILRVPISSATPSIFCFITRKMKYPITSAPAIGAPTSAIRLSTSSIYK